MQAHSSYFVAETSIPCCVATDCHDTVNRKSRIRQGFDLIAQKEGEQTAKIVCLENPQRIINSESLLLHENF